MLLEGEVGDDCTIHAPVWIGNEVKIGNRCKIQAFAFIPDGVTIGDDCFLGPHVCFTNDLYPPSNRRADTVLGQGVSIGANTTIICGVHIGDNARVGAGSVVTKNVPAGALVYGVPARLVQ